MPATLDLWTIADVESATSGPAADADLRAIASWSRSFLLEEHPALGRTGPVCPYTRTAMESDCYFLAQPRLDGRLEAIRAAVPPLLDTYLARLPALPARLRPFLTFAIVLSDYRDLPSADLDRVQAALKPDFVRQGLMIGQFHPDCDAPGLWNDAFRPLRSPVPLLAIRAMVKYDLPFLVGDERFVAEYVARFG